MSVLPKWSACMYQIGCSISLKVKGLSTANSEKNPSVLYQSYRDLSEVEDTILSPDLSKGSDFSATDCCKAKSLLWGCLQRKFEATHKILLQLPIHSHFWGPSAHQQQEHRVILQYFIAVLWDSSAADSYCSEKHRGQGPHFLSIMVLLHCLVSSVVTEDYLCCWGIPMCIICRFVPQTFTFPII